MTHEDFLRFRARSKVKFDFLTKFEAEILNIRLLGNNRLCSSLERTRRNESYESRESMTEATLFLGRFRHAWHHVNRFGECYNISNAYSQLIQQGGLKLYESKAIAYMMLQFLPKAVESFHSSC